MFASQAVVEGEAPEEDDLAAGFAEGGDAGGGEPAVWVGGVVVVQDARELLVGGVAGSFALEGHDDCFGGVAVEEGVEFGEEVAEVFRAGEGDGEDGVDEDELVVGGIIWVFGLDPDVEEADAVVELFGGRCGLASDGREGFVTSGRIVRAWDGEGGERG